MNGTSNYSGVSDELASTLDVIMFDRTVSKQFEGTISKSVDQYIETVFLAAALERYVEELGLVKNALFEVTIDPTGTDFTAVPGTFATLNVSRAYTLLLERRTDLFYDEELPGVIEAFHATRAKHGK